MNPKTLLRQFLPFGLVESRHRKFRLSRLNLPNSVEIESAVQSCRFDLWPASLRNSESPWTLVDVGANVGNFVQAASRLKTLKSVYAFEPQPSCQLELAARLQRIPAATLIPAAVGRIDGHLEFHVTENSRMASGLRPDEGMNSAYATNDFTVTETISVPMVTLDSALPEGVDFGLLKLDVQGFEIEALAGASQTLRRTSAVLIEVNYVRHYSAGATFDDIYRALRGQGFRLFGISEPFGSADGEPLWADAMFVRSHT